MSYCHDIKASIPKGEEQAGVTIASRGWTLGNHCMGVWQVCYTQCQSRLAGAPFKTRLVRKFLRCWKLSWPNAGYKEWSTRQIVSKKQIRCLGHRKMKQMR